MHIQLPDTRCLFGSVNGLFTRLAHIPDGITHSFVLSCMLLYVYNEVEQLVSMAIYLGILKLDKLTCSFMHGLL